jgi:hypothetical protein
MIWGLSPAYDRYHRLEKALGDVDGFGTFPVWSFHPGKDS